LILVNNSNWEDLYDGLGDYGRARPGKPPERALLRAAVRGRPQVALVGFGTPVERPWVVNGEVDARRVLMATVSADHRASDGHAGARFLADIARRLQSPETL
jgi:pyruvate/2-oxoglutarate dehydrogenase complex dihydrolipoamide acyltransferase (E2) component